MVVLHFTSLPQTLCRQSSSSRLPSAVTHNAFSRVVRGRNSVNLQTAQFNGVSVEGKKQRGAMVVKATAEVDGADPLPETSNENSLPVEELPLESKLELKMQQKMKMKLAKKIRLRRKRLVRKRQLRKKGRWPPSKMKKNKNV